VRESTSTVRTCDLPKEYARTDARRGGSARPGRHERTIGFGGSSRDRVWMDGKLLGNENCEYDLRTDWTVEISSKDSGSSGCCGGEDESAILFILFVFSLKIGSGLVQRTKIRRMARRKREKRRKW
jgi:hypothetical protein